MATLRENLSARIYRVNKLFRLKIQDTIRPYNLTTDQWVILEKIYHESGRYNQRELAEACFKERAAITRTLDIMEKKNLIERRDAKKDRRAYKLFITKHGIEIFEKTQQLVEKMEEHIDGSLTSEELNEAIRLMSKLENSLRNE